MSEIDDPVAFMLASLQDEQRRILWMMEQANQAHAPEGALLDWALETVVTAYRDFKAGRIDWMTAARAYHAASSATAQCDNAMFMRRIGLEVENG